MQTVAWIFGIPHPTGFPAYVLSAGVFAHVLPVATPAWRVSLFCTLLAIGCVALVYGAIAASTRDRVTAVCCACLFAFGWYFWIYGARAEIHTMSAFCGALTLYFALRGYYERSTKAFGAAAAAWGVGLATHPIVLFVLPSLLLLAAARRGLFTWRSAALGLLLAGAPLLLYAYLPLRSHAVVARGLDPAPSIGKPAGAAIWNTDNPQTLHGFVRLVTGAEFNAGGSIARMFDLPAYSAKTGTFGAAMYTEFTPVGAVAAVICLALIFRRRAVVALALLLSVLLPAAFALAYPPVVEIERYFFIPMIALTILIGLGAATLDPRYRNFIRLPVAGAAAFLLVGNYSDARTRAAFGAEPLIAEVRAKTPNDAIVISDWTRGTALAYAAYVERRFGARTIDIAWPYQDVRYLPGWLARRPVYYVGRPVLRSHRLLLCPQSAAFPIYTVRLKPGHC